MGVHTAYLIYIMMVIRLRILEWWRVGVVGEKGVYAVFAWPIRRRLIPGILNII